MKLLRLAIYYDNHMRAFRQDKFSETCVVALWELCIADLHIAVLWQEKYQNIPESEFHPKSQKIKKRRAIINQIVILI